MRMEMKLNGNRQVALTLCLWFAMDIEYKTIEWQKWEKYFCFRHIYWSTEEPEERAISWHSNNGCDKTRCNEVSLVSNNSFRSNLQELIRHGRKQLPLNPCIANLYSNFFCLNFGSYPLPVRPTADQGVDSIQATDINSRNNFETIFRHWNNFQTFTDFSNI